MSLADYQPQRSTVAFKGGDMSVRGLSLDDVAVLMNQHLGDIDKLFGLYDGSVDENLKVMATAQFAIGLVREAPALVAHTIALASDEPDHVAQARRLPIPVQVEAIKAIVNLTFDEAGGAKNFLSSLSNLIAAIAPTANQTASNT